MARKDTKTPKAKTKIVYKPDIAKLVKRRTTVAVKDDADVQKLVVRRKVRRYLTRGVTHDKIARLLGMDTKDVVNVSRDICKDWITDEALGAVELREVELQKLRAMHELAMYEAFPHPLSDDLGNPIMIRNCDCVDPSDELYVKPCVIASHNKRAMSQASKEWMDVSIRLSQRIAAMGGFDAADKHKERLIDTMERTYVGVPAKAIDAL